MSSPMLRIAAQVKGYLKAAFLSLTAQIKRFSSVLNLIFFQQILTSRLCNLFAKEADMRIGGKCQETRVRTLSLA